MKDRERFGSLMLSLSIGLKMYGRELDKPMQAVYWKALADLDDASFERACTTILRTDSDFPPVSRILAVARPSIPDAAILRVMNGAWLEAKELASDGIWWRESTVRERFGLAAARAFRACGGSAGFRAMDDERRGDRIKAAFIETYRREVELDPVSALPEGDTKAAVLALLAP